MTITFNSFSPAFGSESDKLISISYSASDFKATRRVYSEDGQFLGSKSASLTAANVEYLNELDSEDGDRADAFFA